MHEVTITFGLHYLNVIITKGIEKLEEEKRIQEELERKRLEEEERQRKIEEEKRRVEEEKRKAEELKRLHEEAVRDALFIFLLAQSS